ncbi:hypothetical protein VMCG_09002 [Cytospora schulzeri]|uniref:Uncharacterized protein n=1 Tax=Cytospora schulzeri TaxID=448051 RepID=A0A423VPP1_9PEZI|nr:hypothetical protein VMCG_09002 [Valsa malicola]
MRAKLNRNDFEKRPPVAQSSANMTIALGGQLRQMALTKGRLAESEVVKPKRDEGCVELGRFLCTRQCLRIHAVKDEQLSLISVKFHDHPRTGYKGPEWFPLPIPDFSGSWSECKFERDMTTISVGSKKGKSIEGGPYGNIYWCANTDMEESHHIKCLLGFSSDPVPLARQFWHGDVFLGKWHEKAPGVGPKVEDVPLDVLEAFKEEINYMWKTEQLEEQSRLLSAFGADAEKFDYDKEVLKARL